MQRRNTQALKEVILQILKEQHLQEKLNDKHIIESWPVVLGQNISKYTTHLSVKNKTLYVSLTSAVLRHELFLSREEIKNALNKYVGAEVITEIVLR